MAHIDQMLAKIFDVAKRAEAEAQYSKPLPTISRRFFPAGDLKKPNLDKYPAAAFYIEMEGREGRSPVPCIMFAQNIETSTGLLKDGRRYDRHRHRAVKEFMDQIVRDMHALGVNAQFFRHTHVDERTYRTYQAGVVLPVYIPYKRQFGDNTVVVSDPANSEAAIFLRYLIDKGYLSPDDPGIEEAFSAYTRKLASTEKIQEIVGPSLDLS